MTYYVGDGLLIVGSGYSYSYWNGKEFVLDTSLYNNAMMRGHPISDEDAEKIMKGELILENRCGIIGGKIYFDKREFNRQLKIARRRPPHWGVLKILEKLI